MKITLVRRWNMSKEIEMVNCPKCGKLTSNHRGICLHCDASLQQKEKVKLSIDERDLGSSCEGDGLCPVR
jgi:uncharacterized OB-fold protein